MKNYGKAVGTYKRKTTCGCGTVNVKGSVYFRLGSLKLCAGCLRQTLDALYNQKPWHKRNVWSVKYNKRKVYCKGCGKQMLSDTLHAHSYAQGSFSERFCVVCVQEMYDYVKEYDIHEQKKEDPTLMSEEELDKLLLEMRFGKDTVRRVKQ